MKRSYTTPDENTTVSWEDSPGNNLSRQIQLLAAIGITHTPTEEEILKDKLEKLDVAEENYRKVRTFINVNSLSELIIGSRIAALDPFARVSAHNVSIEGVNYVVVKSTLSDLQINNELALPITAEETDALNSFASAITNFNNIPAWASMPVQDLVDAANTNFFGGDTEEAVKNRIDTQVSSFAAVRTALKDLVTELYKTHDREIKLIKSSGYTRDYLIRLRR